MDKSFCCFLGKKFSDLIYLVKGAKSFPTNFANVLIHCHTFIKPGTKITYSEEADLISDRPTVILSILTLDS